MSHHAAWFTAASSITVTAGALVAVLRYWRPRWQQNRKDKAEWRRVLHGKADETDARGVVIEEGYGPLSVQVRDLKRILTNGMSHRLEQHSEGIAHLAHGQDEIQQTVIDLRQRAADAARLAGEAATTSARVEQQHRDDVGRIGEQVEQINEKVEDLRETTRERLERAELRAEAMQALAVELGLPWTTDDDEPDGP